MSNWQLALTESKISKNYKDSLLIAYCQLLIAI